MENGASDSTDRADDKVNQISVLLNEMFFPLISHVFVDMMTTGFNWRKALPHYSSGRFNMLSFGLKKDGSPNIGSEWTQLLKVFFSLHVII